MFTCIRVHRLNWTKVGLKAHCALCGAWGAMCLNWTKVGLKGRPGRVGGAGEFDV